MSAVWRDATELAGAELLLLLALADHANSDGVCWPAVEKLAAMARVSTRQAQRYLARLEAAGYLRRDTTGGRGRPAITTLQRPELWNKKGDTLRMGDIQASPIPAQKGDILRTERVTSSALKGDIAPHTRDDPSIDPPIEPSGRDARATPPTNRRIVVVKSPYIVPDRFTDGYVQPGAGRNAVEVYYERFSINLDAARLTARKEDDLVRLCPDLDRLRAIVTEYSRTNYKPGRVDLILDWYRDGPPSQRKAALPSQPTFGLQRQNGDNYAAAIQTSAPAAEEQPAYDSEFGQRIRESQRRAAEEYAAKQAARRGVQMPHL